MSTKPPSDEQMFSADFLKKVVGDGDDIVNLCRDCHCVHVCHVFQQLMTTYNNFGVAQVAVNCPHYISVEDVRRLDNSRQGTSE